MHPANSSYGENQYWTNAASINAVDVVKHWYDQVSAYKYAKGEFSTACGNFTQVVWKSSKQIGVGIASTITGDICIVIFYDPPGNYKGKFRENVLLPKKISYPSTTKALEKVESCISNYELEGIPVVENEIVVHELKDFTAFQEDCLRAHNKYRQLHGVPHLALNQKVCDFAQAWANVRFFFCINIVYYIYLLYNIVDGY